MRANTGIVVEFGVGSKLGTSILSRPLLSSLHEKAPETAPTLRWFDVPALEIPDSIACAALRLQPHRELGEADKYARVVLSDQNCKRITGMTTEEVGDV